MSRWFVTHCLFSLYHGYLVFDLSLSWAEEKGQIGVIKAGNTGNNSQPVQKAEVPTDDE